MDPFATLTIDYESEPGSWAEVLPYCLNIKILAHNDEVSSDKCESKS